MKLSEILKWGQAATASRAHEAIGKGPAEAEGGRWREWIFWRKVERSVSRDFSRMAPASTPLWPMTLSLPLPRATASQTLAQIRPQRLLPVNPAR